MSGRMYSPLTLPKAPNFGYMNPDDPVPIQSTEVEQIRIPEPEQSFRQMNEGFEPIQIPDVVRVQYGAGDFNIVKNLLAVVNDKEHQLSGVSKEFATRMLTKWGYPTDPSAWTADVWEAKLAERALDPNPLTFLGG